MCFLMLQRIELFRPSYKSEIYSKDNRELNKKVLSYEEQPLSNRKKKRIGLV